jgi:adenine deaminase
MVKKVLTIFICKICTMKISGNIVDIISKRIFSGTLIIENGFIKEIVEENKAFQHYILPGFIDSHVHIESSLLTPNEFAKAALKNGVIGAVCDPHEIANVAGIVGIDFMQSCAKDVLFYFLFGAPSCVPASPFDSSGANLSAKEIEYLFETGRASFLAEMMNFVGVVNEDKEVLAKLALAAKYHLPVDGHAPGLNGEGLKKYVQAGISTDHECTGLQEALEKIECGMKILIRNGSAAKNLEDLALLFRDHADSLMLCSDDIHADHLLEGGIRGSVKWLVANGYDIFQVLKVACVHPVEHYHFKSGLLRVGDSADFIMVDNLRDFNVFDVYIKGVSAFNVSGFNIPANVVYPFRDAKIALVDLKVEKKSDTLRVIEVIDKQIVTNELFYSITNSGIKYFESTVSDDILKLVVCSRYENKPPVVAFVKGFKLKYGAIASSVAHDSHNIIAVGVRDEDIVGAINIVIENKGGLAFFSEREKEFLPLKYSGLMTDMPAEEVAVAFNRLEKKIAEVGCALNSPIMNLSFLALSVIPTLKITDKGLFKIADFSRVDLFC